VIDGPEPTFFSFFFFLPEQVQSPTPTPMGTVGRVAGRVDATGAMRCGRGGDRRHNREARGRRRGERVGVQVIAVNYIRTRTGCGLAGLLGPDRTRKDG
jgi:hypothetical protein